MPNPSRPHPVATARGPALAALAVLLAGVLLSACGGSSPQSAAARERSNERQDEAKAASFAKCLREHGVHAETVSGAGANRALKVEGTSGPAQMEHAQKFCAKYRPAPKRLNLSPQQKVELEEKLQKFAKCMREHGIKVEASTQGGVVGIGIHSDRGSGEPNPGSPGFQRAQEACQSLMPRPPGAKLGGAPSQGASKAPAGGGSVGFSVAGG